MNIKNLAATFVSGLILFTSCGMSIKALAVQDTNMDPGKVQLAIKNMDLNISLTWIFPAEQQQISTTNEYSMKIKDGLVNTRLPFIGNNYGAAGFGADAAIVLKDSPIKIIEKKKGNNGEYLISFDAKAESETYTISLTIWSDGTVNILCDSTERSTMNYAGELRLQ